MSKDLMMVNNLKDSSSQVLKKTLGQLDKFADCVFWIRDREMTQQIYQGGNFKEIWQRDPELIFKMPLIWLDYLQSSNKEFYMSQLQQRHEAGYYDESNNYAIYKIETPDKEIKSILCHCVLCKDYLGEQYVVGMAKYISDDRWQQMYNEKKSYHTEDEHNIETEFLSLLKQHFGVVKKKPFSFETSIQQQFYENLTMKENVSFSPREIESLYHLCQGKTAKEIAKQMNISPRTVEAYIEQICTKSECKNRLELISYFSRYIPRNI